MLANAILDNCSEGNVVVRLVKLTRLLSHAVTLRRAQPRLREALAASTTSEVTVRVSCTLHESSTDFTCPAPWSLGV
jgi:hypothetical protein